MKAIQDKFLAAFSHRPSAIKLLLQSSLNYRKAETTNPDQFSCPVYIISSIEDMMLPHVYAFEYAQSIHADGFYEVKAGHLPLAEALEDYNQILLEILNKHS